MIKLYAHEPRSLLPLLKQHLPYTIGIVGCILNSPLPGDETDLPVLDAVYATFPSSDSGKPQAPSTDNWLVILALPLPADQIRFYHSCEARPPSAQSTDELQAAEDMIAASLLDMAKRYPSHDKAGFVHYLWGGIARTTLRGKGRGKYDVWLAPDVTCDAAGGNAVGPDLADLVLDHGRPGDEDIIYSHNNYRSPAYYASRAQNMTVLRPRSAPAIEGTSTSTSGFPAPIAWIITLTDGSQGALHTMPDYRRRGLARMIVNERLRACTTGGSPSYAVIEQGNVASEKLWEGLGWRKGWEVTWVRQNTLCE